MNPIESETGSSRANSYAPAVGHVAPVTIAVPGALVEQQKPAKPDGERNGRSKDTENWANHRPDEPQIIDLGGVFSFIDLLPPEDAEQALSDVATGALSEATATALSKVAVGYGREKAHAMRAVDESTAKMLSNDETAELLRKDLFRGFMSFRTYASYHTGKALVVEKEAPNGIDTLGKALGEKHPFLKLQDLLKNQPPGVLAELPSHLVVKLLQTVYDSDDFAEASGRTEETKELENGDSDGVETAKWHPNRLHEIEHWQQPADGVSGASDQLQQPIMRRAVEDIPELSPLVKVAEVQDADEVNNLWQLWLAVEEVQNIGNAERHSGNLKAEDKISSETLQRMERASKFLSRLRTRPSAINVLDNKVLEKIRRFLLRKLRERAANQSRYVYERLRDEKSEIRLLHLLCARGEKLRCHLGPAILSDANYVALSYEWGSADRMFWIEVVDREGNPLGR
jgi:hypothetical protein